MAKQIRIAGWLGNTAWTCPNEPDFVMWQGNLSLWNSL